MTNSTIPTVDLSPFFCEGNEEGKNKARKMLSQGCSEYGVFQVVNHGVPLGLLSTLKTFFAYPAEEKHKISPDPLALFPACYNQSRDKLKEDFFMCSPSTTYNVFPGAIVVNVGDVIQVLTNNKIMSATHRVVSPKGRTRLSLAYNYNLGGNTWVEPLSQFTQETGPKYRGYLQKEYVALRLKQKAHPPARNEDRISIDYYAISAQE
ncbi:hypothetical protein RJ639_036628 [Escallonia herrerae]|uniref:Uncharacterized protein n=1 Tax=Escallonia herrerae TaxID=1293975 RepID=A0AA88WVD4_9ASTE|nr:hypothetical protein RJ639_036628 [Escallonia herrerae]